MKLTSWRAVALQVTDEGPPGVASKAGRREHPVLLGKPCAGVARPAIVLRDDPLSAFGCGGVDKRSTLRTACTARKG